jgi:hypothetical protein
MSARLDPTLGRCPNVLDPFRFLLLAVSGWMNQQQRQVIECLREENRVLREQLGGRRMARILKGNTLGPPIKLVT